MRHTTNQLTHFLVPLTCAPLSTACTARVTNEPKGMMKVTRDDGIPDGYRMASVEDVETDRSVATALLDRETAALDGGMEIDNEYTDRGRILESVLDEPPGQLLVVKTDPGPVSDELRGEVTDALNAAMRMTENEVIAGYGVGARVQSGSDWADFMETDAQDGGPGSLGTIIDVQDKFGSVAVEWDLGRAFK